MTPAQNNWLRNQVFRAFISGESQQDIGHQLNISVGTVNSHISEIVKSDDTAEMQRQIAIVAKKNKISIKQIAANLRYKNLIKLNMLDEKKAEKFLNTLDKMFSKYSVPPTTAANLMFSAIETMLKENVEPNKLEETIKSKISRLGEDKKEVEAEEKLLEETKERLERERKTLEIKEKDLSAFHQVWLMLKTYRRQGISSEYDRVARALIDMKKMGYSAKVIISKYDRFGSLIEAKKRLDKSLRESEELLHFYGERLKLKKRVLEKYDNAFDNFSRLTEKGLEPADIFSVSDILKHDFPQDTIEELKKSLRDYGRIAAALSRIKREYEQKTGKQYETY